MLLGEEGLRDSRVITGIGLALIFTIVISAYLLPGVGVAVVPEQALQTAPRVTSHIVDQTQTSTSTSNTTTVIPYPTTISQDLLSVVIARPGNSQALGMAKNSDSIDGNAYGIVKQAVKLSKTLIEDNVTVTAVTGQIPGKIDTIVFEANYNGDVTPFCTGTDKFDATGLASYTTMFSCKYMGAGTYTFKVYVYDDTGTVIGDPTDSLTL